MNLDFHSAITKILAMTLAGWTGGLAPVWATEPQLLEATLRTFPAPVRFAEHRPDFRWQRRQVVVPGREQPQEVVVIWDADRAIAVWGLGPTIWTRRLNWLAFRPGEGLDAKDLEQHLATHTQRFGYDAIWSLQGVQFITGPAYPSDTTPLIQMAEIVQGHGRTLSFISTGKTDPAALKASQIPCRYSYQYTVSVDQVTGYKIMVERHLWLEREPAAGSSLLVDLPHGGGMHQPWAHWQAWGTTIFTPSGCDGRQGFSGFANNHVVATKDQSPFSESAGRRTQVAAHGWSGFAADDRGWGVVWSWGSLGPDGKDGVSFASCPNFLEHTCGIRWATRADGEKGHFMRTVDVIQALPPETVTGILMHTEFAAGPRPSAIILPIGRIEDFEHQPVPSTVTWRGLRLHNASISEEHAFSGRRSIRVNGSAEEPKGGYATPYFRLEGGKTYRFQAHVKVKGEGTKAWLRSEGMLDPDKVASVCSPAVTAHEDGAWTPIHCDIVTPPGASSVEPRLRLVVVGPGVAYFDDVGFIAVSQDR